MQFKVPAAVETGFIDHRFGDVRRGITRQYRAETIHGLVVHGDGVIGGNARRVVRRSVMLVDAGGFAFVRWFQLGSGTVRAEDIGGDRVGVPVDDEVEAVGEECLKHQLDVIGRSAGRGAGIHVVVVQVEPGWA